jgi:N-methylhydantoinase A
VVARIYAELEAEAHAWLAAEGEPGPSRRLDRLADLRYRHQGFEITVPWEERDLSVAGLIARFHARHRQLYTYALPDAPVEIVTLRVRAAGGAPRFTLPRRPARRGRVRARRPRRRPVFFAGTGWVAECSILDRDALPPGAVVAGPAVVEQLDSTTVILPGQRAGVDAYGNLLIRVADTRSRTPSSARIRRARRAAARHRTARQ